MGAAVDHHPAHFLPGAVAVGEIHGMMVEKLDAVLMELLRHSGNIVMKQRKHRKKIPSEVSTKEHGGGNTRLGKAFCTGFDAV